MPYIKTIFSVEPSILGKLAPKPGVDFFAALLRCEAIRCQVSLNKITISGDVTTADGGIDARIESPIGIDSLLIQGDAFFQIKTGSSFKPWLESNLLKELFGKNNKSSAQQRFGSQVQHCMEKRGRYVLLTLGYDLSDEQRTKAKELLNKIFAEAGFPDANADVFGQQQIIDYLSYHPSLSLDLQDRGTMNFQSFASWADIDSMKNSLKLANEQKKFIETIRNVLKGTDIQHLRITGPSGCGKTRLTLEAVSEEELKNTVMYIRQAKIFINGPLLNELLKSDRNYTAILIIDECGETERAFIWESLKGQQNIKLITIDYFIDNSSDNFMHQLPCPLLLENEIQQIIAEYIGPSYDTMNWAQWCGGNPGLAHMIGHNLKFHPENILKEPATVTIWDGLLFGQAQKTDTEKEQILTVMCYLALFKQFGFEEPFLKEANFIYSLIVANNPAITKARYRAIINNQRKCGTLRGETTLVITFKVLHAYLWVKFWEASPEIDVIKLLMDMPESLKQNFLRNFIYAHADDRAKNIIKKMLSPDTGPFKDNQFMLSETGSRLLNSLAEADPKATLFLIEHRYENSPITEFKEYILAYENIIFALEKIAVWTPCFLRATEMLIKFFLAADASGNNIAESILLKLFEIGNGWAPTESPPNDRFPILERLIKSSDPNQYSLGFKLCNRWLSTRGEPRVIGVEYHGLKPRINFWAPQTNRELEGYWLNAWTVLRNEIKNSNNEKRSLGIKQLIKSASELIDFPGISNIIIDDLSQLAPSFPDHKKELIELISKKLSESPTALPDGQYQKILDLDKQLSGISFEDQFQRYVILATSWDEKAIDINNSSNNLSSRIKKLADEAAKKVVLLKNILFLCISSTSKHLITFGTELVQKDQDFSLDFIIFEAHSTTQYPIKALFLSGYLTGLHNLDEERWENLSNRLLETKKIKDTAVSAVISSGLSTAILEKITILLLSGEFDFKQYRSVGHAAKKSKIQPSAIYKITKILIEKNNKDSILSALMLINDYFLTPTGILDISDVPEEVLWDLLTNNYLLEENSEGFYWHHVMKIFLTLYPEKNIQIFEKILENPRCFAFSHSGNYRPRIADLICKKYPVESWSLIANKLTSNSNDYGHAFRQWLQDELNPMQYFDPNAVIGWIKEDSINRIPLISHFLPKTLDFSEDVSEKKTTGSELTRLFIEEFSNIESVKDLLIERFTTGARSGLRSESLAAINKNASRWLAKTESLILKTWLNKLMDTVKDECDLMKKHDERLIFTY